MKQHERLEKARRDAGYKFRRTPAKDFEWNESTYRTHELGTRQFGEADAKKYARAFGVSYLWLLHGVDEKGREGMNPREEKQELPQDKRPLPLTIEQYPTLAHALEEITYIVQNAEVAADKTFSTKLYSQLTAKLLIEYATTGIVPVSIDQTYLIDILVDKEN